MSSKKAEGSSKQGLWLGAPVRALSRACDSYVRGMSACAGRMPTPAGTYGGRGGFAPGTMEAWTFNSSSRRRGGDDVNELVRARQRPDTEAMTWRQRSRRSWTPGAQPKRGNGVDR